VEGNGPHDRTAADARDETAQPQPQPTRRRFRQPFRRFRRARDPDASIEADTEPEASKVTPLHPFSQQRRRRSRRAWVLPAAVLLSVATWALIAVVVWLIVH
jgi:hypothetical protein